MAPRVDPPQVQPSEPATSACARCGEPRLKAHMTRLKSGRLLCQRCVAVLRGQMERKAAGLGDLDPPPRTAAASVVDTALGAVEEASDPDWGGTGPEAAAADPLDAAEIDSIPCPKCGATALFGVPHCDACGITLADLWESEDVIHAVSETEWHKRYLRRAALLTCVVVIFWYAWPERTEQTAWEGISRDEAGAALDEKALGIVVHPAVQRVRRELALRNEDDFPWFDVVMQVNPAPSGSGGFVLQIPLMRAGEMRKYPLTSFTKSDGTRFTPDLTLIERIDLRARTSAGLALWSDPEFIDATEVATVD